MEDVKWLLCPVCGNKTRLKIRDNTELKNFPLYCFFKCSDTIAEFIHSIKRIFQCGRLWVHR